MSYPESNSPYDYGSLDDESHKSQDGCRNVMLGCLLAAIVVVCLMAFGSVFLYRKAKSVSADFAVEAVTKGLDQTHLPEEQRSVIVERFRELADDFRNGQLSFEEIGEIVERFVESKPVIASGAELVVRKHILDKIEFDEGEAERVERLVQRFSRGIAEGKIDESDFDRVKDIVLVQKGENEYELKELSEQDVRDFVDQLGAMVQEAEIPDEPYQVDVAQEVERIIQDVRGN